MNVLTKTLTGVALGALLGASGVWLLGGDRTPDDSDTASNERKPLYWVAPMDPNYKRDKPGKSPMGMDLIPVYEEEGATDSPGTVTINADVINNMGVRTAPVVRGEMTNTVQTVGYVQYDEDHLIHIAPRVEGWIEKLYVKTVGDPVKSGEPLYELYSPTLVNAQEELVLALKRNNPKLIQAAIERLTALQIPKTEIDRVRKTGWVSQTIIVNAPQSGVVDNLMVREGMFVKPGISLMSIGQLEHIWVIGELFESQAMRVQEGDGVRMHLDYLPGREWLGTVDYIYPTLDTTTRTAQVRVHFDNPDGFLKPGMFAQMRIAATPVDNTLLIPKEALIRTGSQSRVVLAFGDGSFKSIAVKVGQVSDEQAEITSGLNEGDRIVASAQFLIDSESSKTSDFRRMNHGFDDDEKVETPTSVWVRARIESLMTEHRMLTLAHESIDAWQWPAMVMDFSADTSIELEGLKPGMNLHVEITRNGDGNYVISQIHRPDSASGEMLMKHHDQSMDQGQHQPKGQNGMAMDHSNHKAMNHDAMNRDHSQHSEEGNP